MDRTNHENPTRQHDYKSLKSRINFQAGHTTRTKPMSSATWSATDVAIDVIASSSASALVVVVVRVVVTVVVGVVVVVEV